MFIYLLIYLVVCLFIYLFIYLQQQGRMRGYGLEACADGPAEDFTDSPTSPPKETPPPQPRRYTSQGSQLQCPNCRKLFPHDLLENHMRDCTGDD